MKIITNKFRIHLADQFEENFAEEVENMYMYIGYPRDWANTTNPPTPNTNVEFINYDYWSTMLAAKKVSTADVSNVIPRYDWVSGKVYRQYDSSNPNLYDVPTAANTFYVVTDEFNVYKCLFNEYGTASTVKPTGQALQTLATVDGYRWKFMYNISAAEVFKFVTPQFVNVQNLAANNGTQQWNVIQGASNGSIDYVNVTAGGTLYKFHQANIVSANTSTFILGSSANTSNAVYVGSSVFITTGPGATQLRNIVGYNGTNKRATISPIFVTTPNTQSQYIVSPTIVIGGDGIETTAYSNGVGGILTHINVIDKGLNYAVANVSITANSLFGAGAIGVPFISPTNGHGYDAVSELGGHNIMITTQFNADEANTFPISNDFRTYGLIKAPLLANGAIANATSYSQTTDLTVSSATGTFPQDGIITGGTSGANATILFFSNTNGSGTEGVLEIVDLDGVFTATETLTANNGTTTILDSINSGDLKEFSGELMYVENIQAIQRAPDQIEDVKIIFKF